MANKIMLNDTDHDSYLLSWKGPLVLQGCEGELFLKSPVVEQSGIYLFTVEHNNGYLIYMAGWTTRPFKKRLKEHIATYRKGTYTIFDPESLQNGKRVELWHGMWMGKSTNTPEMKQLFHSRYQELELPIESLLSAFRIFLAPLNTERRSLARIEAAIMNLLYSAEEPISTIPDKGMALAPRWIEEKPFLVNSTSTVLLYGLPELFEA
ncbi:MAG: hypothetical protein AB1757_00765 [Acidobacteriota bacterium]